MVKIRMLALPLAGLVSWVVFSAAALFALSPPVSLLATESMPVFCAPEGVIEVLAPNSRPAQGRAAPLPTRAPGVPGGTPPVALAWSCPAGLAR